MTSCENQQLANFFPVSNNSPRSLNFLFFPKVTSVQAGHVAAARKLKAKWFAAQTGKQWYTMNYHCLKEQIRKDLMTSSYITSPGTSKLVSNNFASPHFSTNILASWCLSLSHIFTQKFLKFYHPPLLQA